MDSLSCAWVGPIVLGYVSPVSPVSLIRAAFISCEFGSRDFSQVPLYCRCWSAFLSKCTWIHKSALLYVHARARIETHTRVKRRQRLYRFCIYLALNFFFFVFSPFSFSYELSWTFSFYHTCVSDSVYLFIHSSIDVRIPPFLFRFLPLPLYICIY